MLLVGVVLILPVLFDDVDNDVDDDDDDYPATSWLSSPPASAASTSHCTFAISGNM